uniref:Uncharacterized protein n=1 Tax=Ditylenchus dipsaci TaxID=166011 RepID=A0A915DQR8_9BILA
MAFCDLILLSVSFDSALPQEKKRRIKMLNPRGGHTRYFCLVRPGAASREEAKNKDAKPKWWPYKSVSFDSALPQEKKRRIKMLNPRGGHTSLSRSTRCCLKRRSDESRCLTRVVVIRGTKYIKIQQIDAQLDCT